MPTTVNDETRRAELERQMQLVDARDAVGSHALYHDDAVLEFPQSGERFEGVDNFRDWRSQYPGAVEFRLRRLSGSGDVWVRELSVSYDGGPWMLGVAVLEFRGGRIARERIYVTEPWEALEWRAGWRSATTAV
jgi:ketosteroid isomerase-like protein